MTGYICATVTNRNISFFWYPFHMLPVELWESNFKSSSLPVDRKCQKGQTNDNYIILLYDIIQNINVNGLM